jgi:hypothetical protein
LPLLTPNLGWLSSSSLVPLGRLPISAATASRQDRLPPSCASCSRLRLLSLHPTPTLLKGSDQLGNDRWSRDEQYTLFCGCVAGWQETDVSQPSPACTTAGGMARLESKTEEDQRRLLLPCPTTVVNPCTPSSRASHRWWICRPYDGSDLHGGSKTLKVCTEVSEDVKHLGSFLFVLYTSNIWGWRE